MDRTKDGPEQGVGQKPGIVGENRGYWGYREITESDKGKGPVGSENSCGCGCGCGGGGCGCGE